MYAHYSFFNSDGNTNYSNEDSIFVPPAFNHSATDDWIGFAGIDVEGNPKVGDSFRDGWMPLPKTIVSDGATAHHNSTDEDYWDGQFHWVLLDMAVDVDRNGAFVSDLGHQIVYDVAESQLGETLTFSIATREYYNAIDGFLFLTDPELLTNSTQNDMEQLIPHGDCFPDGGDFNTACRLDTHDIDDLTTQSASGTNPDDWPYDVTMDGLVNSEYVSFWIRNLFGSWLGDANLDGEFNTDDLIEVLAANTYEQDKVAVWTTGDFNGSGYFDTDDLIDARADGGYEQGSRPFAVPEPATVFLLLTALSYSGLLACRRSLH